MRAPAQRPPRIQDRPWFEAVRRAGHGLVLLSQGMTRPGIVSGQHWGKAFERVVEPDPYRARPEWVDTHMQFSIAKDQRIPDLSDSQMRFSTRRPTPRSYADPRLSNPAMR